MNRQCCCNSVDSFLFDNPVGFECWSARTTHFVKSFQPCIIYGNQKIRPQTIDQVRSDVRSKMPSFYVSQTSPSDFTPLRTLQLKFDANFGNLLMTPVCHETNRIKINKKRTVSLTRLRKKKADAHRFAVRGTKIPTNNSKARRTVIS